jgi:hypothetical protein
MSPNTINWYTKVQYRNLFWQSVSVYPCLYQFVHCVTWHNKTTKRFSCITLAIGDESCVSVTDSRVLTLRETLTAAETLESHVDISLTQSKWRTKDVGSLLLCAPVTRMNSTLCLHSTSKYRGRVCSITDSSSIGKFPVWILHPQTDCINTDSSDILQTDSGIIHHISLCNFLSLNL